MFHTAPLASNMGDGPSFMGHCTPSFAQNVPFCEAHHPYCPCVCLNSRCLVFLRRRNCTECHVARVFFFIGIARGTRIIARGLYRFFLVEASGRLLASYERELRVREAIVRGLSTEEPHRRTYMLYLTVRSAMGDRPCKEETLH